MVVHFNLPTKAFSVNAAYYKNRAIKTTDFRSWEESIQELLDEVKILTDLADEFNRVGGEFAVSFIFVYPYHIYYNKAKDISAKTFDLSNVEKPLLDQIFGGRMCVNDRFVTHLQSTKEAGASHEIKVIIELFPKAV